MAVVEGGIGALRNGISEANVEMLPSECVGVGPDRQPTPDGALLSCPVRVGAFVADLIVVVWTW
eukprot:550001-Pyramimonas_sp.AAC.1